LILKQKELELQVETKRQNEQALKKEILEQGKELS